MERAVATVSAHALRVAGITMICLSAVVVAGSLTTEYGFENPHASAAATATSDVTATMLLEFASAHPAYPVALLFGLVLVMTNDDAPLLGS